MAVSLTHTFVSAIPDGADTSVVRPSNWNAEHTLTGTINTLMGFDATGASQSVTVGSGLTYSAGTITATGDGSGTVTSVAALTLGTTGTDLTSTVANGTTTPVITLNVPTASATNRGVLSSTDWTTFNSKGSGTVTSVTATAPVVSTGGTTPVISMAAATASVNGYLTSADWTTFNSKGSGTVTSVTGTAPVVSSGGATPAISMPAATASVNGYLTSADWTTFNNKGSGTVTSVAGTGTVNGITLTGTVTSTGSLTLGGTLSGVDLTTQVTGILPGANGGTGVNNSTNTITIGGNVSTASSFTTTGAFALGLVTTAATTATLPAGTTSNYLISSATQLAANPVTGTPSATTYLRGDGTWATVSGGSMVYPGSGIANSTGTAWGTSYTTTGSGTVVALATSPTLVTPILGTPSSGTLTSCTGLPVSTGISGLGTGVATFLATPTSANLASAVTDETGSGALVFATSPTLVTPLLGTPTSGNLSNCTADGTNAVGYLTIPQNAQTGSYTLVLADSGKTIYHDVAAAAATYTIPANGSVAYALGTTVTFINMSTNAVTVAITTDTLYLAGSGTTGSRTLAQYGVATATKMTSTTWIISGSGLT